MSWIRSRKGSSRRPRSDSRSVPSNQIWPLVGSSSRARQRASVDLPEPDCPTRARSDPRVRVRSMPASASTAGARRPPRPGYRLVSPLTRTSGGSASIFEAPDVAAVGQPGLLRSTLDAGRQPVGATGLEGAPGWQVSWIGGHPGDRRGDALLPGAGREDRHLALALASQLGHVEIVRLLLDAGEDPNRYNPDGNHSHSTPLHQAVIAGHDAVVRLLVERGAKLDIKDTIYQATALGWAIYGGKSEIEKYLRAHGAKTAKELEL